MRPARPGDEPALWAILEPVIRAGETYALPREMTRDAALGWWRKPDSEVFVAEHDGLLLGTYFLRPNQLGGGSHVANAGYMTLPDAQGRGVARVMVQHSIAEARARGFRSFQFNFVVSTNHRAVKTWEGAGFSIAGRLAGAFAHPTLGLVDALVMYRQL
jgi:GNAT superfamily N-acetyltransferase